MMPEKERTRSKKEEIIQALEAADLSDVEVIREEEGVILLRFFYDYDEEELSAAQHFADIEDADEGFDDIASDEQDEDSLDEETAVETVLESVEEAALAEEASEGVQAEEEELTDRDLAYDEDDEFYGGAKEKYLSEIAIDYVGEVLEDLQDDLGMEVQYIGYDLEEDEADSFEFIALVFEKGKALNIEDILDELDI